MVGVYIVIRIRYLTPLNNTNNKKSQKYIPQIKSQLSPNMRCYPPLAPLSPSEEENAYQQNWD
jgi:hypothetical protein